MQQADPGVIGVRLRSDGFVGADRGAHAATYAAVSRFCALPDTCKGAVLAASFFLEDLKFRHPLPAVGEVNCLLGTDGCALPAQGTPVLTMLDNPLQV